MDLGAPKTVRGVITQGARGGDAASGASTDNRAFVRKYKVAHSLTGKDWIFIMDGRTNLPKVSEGGEWNASVRKFSYERADLFGADLRGEHALRHAGASTL